jgi:hypothetical protein
MVFYAHGGLRIDHIPDDITISQLILDPRYGRRPLSQSNRSLLIDAPSGQTFDIHRIKERTESLAKGLQIELSVNVGWSGVIGVFAPNNVTAHPSPFPEAAKCL